MPNSSIKGLIEIYNGRRNEPTENIIEAFLIDMKTHKIACPDI